MKRNQNILFHTGDTQLFQLITAYLNIQNYKVVASPKPVDVFQKLDRQKFSAIMLGTSSELFLDQCLYALSEKASLNEATPLILLNNPGDQLQLESKFASRIKYVIDAPFTLATLGQSVLVSTALG